MKEIITIKDPATGHIRKVGVIEDNIFRKNIKGSKHIFRSANAIGIQSEVIEQLKAKGIKDIIITDTETFAVYQTDLFTFEDKGFDLNLGHGSQRFLCLRYWKTLFKDNHLVSNEVKDEIKS